MNKKEVTFRDPVVEHVVDSFIDRSNVGFKKYGKTLHLIVEIKEVAFPDPDYQNNVLEDLFDQLSPQVDFHFISLRPEMLMLILVILPGIL